MKKIHHAIRVILMTKRFFQGQIDGDFYLPGVKGATDMTTGEYHKFSSFYFGLFVIKAPFKILDYDFITEFNEYKLTANNPQELKKMFLSQLEIAKENIELYNEKLSPIMKNPQTSKRNFCNIFISEDWEITYYNSEPETETRFDSLVYNCQPITNYELAKYSEAFAGYYLTEILKGESVGIEKSFFWTGSQAQLEALCEALKSAGYIHPATTNKVFAAIFSGIEIDANFHQVTWIKKNPKGTTHKTALREFLTLLLGKFPGKTVPLCFMDINKSPISLNKPKKGEYSNYCGELEEIIDRVK